MTAETNIYGGRKIRQGTVVSDKMDKTVVVAVQSNIRHRLYKKTIRREKKFMAHDEKETAKLGDVVRIVEHSPLSRHKRWAVIEVVQRAELPEVAPGSIDLELIGEVKRETPEPEAVATPKAEAPTPEAPIAEIETVLESAAPEATDTMADVDSAESVEAAEPEVPAAEEAEVVTDSSPAPEADAEEEAK